MASRIERDPSADYRRLHAAYQQSLRYAEDVRRLYHQMQRAICQSLLGLANALEAKDSYTRGHSERVAALSRRVASALGLAPSLVDVVGQAGLLHDIGKIGINEHLLLKPGQLSHEEFNQVKEYPLIGYRLLANIKQLDHLRMQVPTASRARRSRWRPASSPSPMSSMR